MRQPVKVWMVGSSLIKDAFVSAKKRPGGTSLGLDRINVSIWWQGKSGMVSRQIKSQLRIMKRYEDPPQLLVLHVSGNDLGAIKVGFLRNNLKNTIRWIYEEFPNTTVVWSQILPRLNWRYSQDMNAMMACRKRINNTISAFVLQNGGCYIRHPDIKSNNTILKSDGVHLTTLGNELFLNVIQGAIESFVLHGSSVFPQACNAQYSCMSLMNNY